MRNSFHFPKSETGGSRRVARAVLRQDAAASIAIGSNHATANVSLTASAASRIAVSIAAELTASARTSAARRISALRSAVAALAQATVARQSADVVMLPVPLARAEAVAARMICVEREAETLVAALAWSE